eukprot:1319769-Ditylum_brightwellii.AAC.1
MAESMASFVTAKHLCATYVCGKDATGSMWWLLQLLLLWEMGLAVVAFAQLRDAKYRVFQRGKSLCGAKECCCNSFVQHL